MSIFGTEQPHKPTDNVEVKPAYSHDVAPSAAKRAQIVPIAQEKVNIANAYLLKSLSAEQTVSRYVAQPVVQPRPVMPAEVVTPVQDSKVLDEQDQNDFLEGFSPDVKFNPNENIIDEAGMVESARQEVIAARNNPVFEPQSTSSPYNVPVEATMGDSSPAVVNATYAENLYQDTKRQDTVAPEAPAVAPAPEAGGLDPDKVRAMVNAAFEEPSSADSYRLAA